MGRNAGGGGGGGGSAGKGGSFGGGPSGHAGRSGSFGGGGRSSGGRSAGGSDPFGLGGLFGGSSGGYGGSRPPQGGFGRGPVIPPGGIGGPVIPPSGLGRGPAGPPPGGGMGFGPVRSGGGRRTGCATAVITLVVIALLVVMAIVISGGGTGQTAAERDITDSTYARTKLEGTTYTDEVFDEIGWINTGNVASGIREFFNKTGVQPAIYLENRPDLIGDTAAQEAEAERIFRELGLSDSAFLFVYLDNNGTDGDWVTWTGNAAGTVMDSEAQQIFEDYLTQNWFSDKNEDAVFIDTFNSTADRIMSRTTNANDVAIWVWIALGIVAAGVVVFVIMKTKRKHEAERAAETERILKTDINDLQDDPLLNKYKDNK